MLLNCCYFIPKRETVSTRLNKEKLSAREEEKLRHNLTLVTSWIIIATLLWPITSYKQKIAPSQNRILYQLILIRRSRKIWSIQRIYHKVALLFIFLLFKNIYFFIHCYIHENIWRVLRRVTIIIDSVTLSNK